MTTAADEIPTGQRERLGNSRSNRMLVPYKTLASKAQANTAALFLVGLRYHVRPLALWHRFAPSEIERHSAALHRHSTAAPTHLFDRMMRASDNKP